MPTFTLQVHWLNEAPLRPSNIRAPGKVANCFAVERFTDELVALANAIFDAAGIRLRTVPSTRQRVLAALA